MRGPAWARRHPPARSRTLRRIRADRSPRAAHASAKRTWCAITERIEPGTRPMRVVVLGGGIIGTASTWFLRQDGHEVTLVERQPGVALETSFANAGQISASQCEPWATPAAPL